MASSFGPTLSPQGDQVKHGDNDVFMCVVFSLKVKKQEVYFNRFNKFGDRWITNIYNVYLGNMIFFFN